MSRIGKRVLVIPAGVEVLLENNKAIVKGKLGQLEYTFSPLIKVEIKTMK